MRVPKRGFNNINRVAYKPLNLSDLEYIAEKHSVTVIDFDLLRKLRVAKKSDKVKVLGNGSITKSLEVKLHAFSASAKAAIEESGGTASVL